MARPGAAATFAEAVDLLATSYLPGGADAGRGAVPAEEGGGGAGSGAAAAGC